MNASSLFAQLRTDLCIAEPGDADRYEALTALAAEMLAAGTDPQAPSRETLYRLGDAGAPCCCSCCPPDAIAMPNCNG